MFTLYKASRKEAGKGRAKARDRRAKEKERVVRRGRDHHRGQEHHLVQQEKGRMAILQREENHPLPPVHEARGEEFPQHLCYPQVYPGDGRDVGLASGQEGGQITMRRPAHTVPIL